MLMFLRAHRNRLRVPGRARVDLPEAAGDRLVTNHRPLIFTGPSAFYLPSPPPGPLRDLSCVQAKDDDWQRLACRRRRIGTTHHTFRTRCVGKEGDSLETHPID